MCGLVSVIAKGKFGLFPKDVKIFAELLLVGQLRGSDGTGVFFDTALGDISYRKAPVPSPDFIRMEGFDDLVTKWTKDSSFIVGHNRFATKGNIIHADTHPFSEGDITLVHNGTLINHKELKDVTVDSHAICHHINENGIDSTLKTMNGAFALIFHDKKNNSLNIIRNTERTLYLIETDSLWILCSEQEMGVWICTRNGVAVKNKYLLESGILNSLDLITREWTTAKKECYKPPPFIGTVVGTTKVLPFTKNKYKNKHKKHNNDSAIGTGVFFFPFKIKPFGNSLYLEGYIPNDDGEEEVEVRLFNNNRHYLTKLLAEDMLYGNITGSAHGSHGKYFVVTDVVHRFTSKNKVVLTADEVADMQDKCDVCDGNFSKLPALIAISNIEADRNINSVNKFKCSCPDCTEYFNKSTKLVGEC